MFCPNYKNKEVFIGFNEIIEALGGTPMTEEEFRSSELRNLREGLDYSAMEAAYKIWHRNGGNTIDKAPNGQASILFQTLLSLFNGDRLAAILAKSKVYSDNFINWFGDWTNAQVNGIVRTVDQDTGNIRLSLESSTKEQPRQIKIEPQGDNKYYVHIRIWDGEDSNGDLIPGDINLTDKQKLFDALYKELPDGAEILFPKSGEDYYATRGTVAALLRLSRDDRFEKGNDSGVLKYKDKDKSIKEFKGTSFVKKPSVSKVVDENGEPLIIYHGTDSEFTIFDPTKGDGNHVAFYFTDSKEMASSYKGGVITLPVFLNVRDSYDIDAKGNNWNNITLNIATEAKTPIDFAEAVLKQLAVEIETAKHGYYDEFWGKYIKDESYINKKIDKINTEALPAMYKRYLDLQNLKPKNIIDKIKNILEMRNIMKRITNIFKNDYYRNSYGSTQENVSTRDLDLILNDRDGLIINNVKDYGSRVENPQPHNVFVLYDPNNVKSATDNIGTYSKIDNDINNLEISQDTPFSTFNFGKMINSYQKLLNGETVSSDELISELLSNENFSGIQLATWTLLSTLNIPIRFSDSLPELKFGRAAYDEDGNSIIELNGELIAKLPAYEVYHGIMHELIHSKTSYILDNPSTELESNFAQTTKAVYQSLLQRIDKVEILPFLPFNVRYSLTTEKEFAAELISSDDVRQELFDLARIIDNKNSNRFVNGIKRLINSAVNVLFNKSAFNTTELQLKDYLKLFKQYLTETEHQRLRTFTKQELEFLYNSLDQNAVDTSVTVEASSNIEKNVKMWSVDDLTIRPSSIRRKYSPQSILDLLSLRLVSIQTKNLNASLKTTAISDTEKQISSLENSQTPRFVQITIFTDYIQTQVKEYVSKLNDVLNGNLSVDFSELLFIKRDTLNIYSSIMSQINQDLKDISSILRIVEEYNESRLGDNISEEDVLSVRQTVQNCIKLLQDGKDVASVVTKNFGIQSIEKVGTEVGDPTIQKHIEDYELNNTFEDTGSVWLWLGSAEFSDNSTVKAITHIIGKANRESEKLAKDAIFEGLEILNRMKIGQKMSDVYERDSKGKFTQYLMRDLNFGEFYRRYDEELVKINKKLGLPLENRIAPEDPTLKIKFNKMRNKWLSENCHRKYVNEYYEAWDEVPVYVREKMLMLNQQIDDLFNRYDIRDEDGYADFSKLPEDAYKLARRLIQSKRALRSPYDEYGRKKQPGDPDYDVYISLKTLDEKLKVAREKITGKSEKSQIEYATKLWQKARDNIINRAGGKEQYQKYLNGEENTFNIKLLDDWDLYNSRVDFKRDAEGDAIIYKEMSNLLMGLDKNIDYGQRYNELKEEIDSILSIYRNEMGEVDLDTIPEEALTILTKGKDGKPGLLKLLNELRKEAISRSPIAKLRSKLFQAYLTQVETERFKIKRKSIEDVLIRTGMYDEGDFDVSMFLIDLYSALSPYGEQWGENPEDFRPYSFAMKTQAKDKELYMEIIPNYNWIERSREVFLNKEWEGEKYGSSLVPLRFDKTGKKLYDNKENFDEMYKQPELKALYEWTLKYMTKSNEKQTNRPFTDNYLLPGIQSSALSIILSTPWGKKTVAFMNEIAQIIGFSTKAPMRDIEQFGSEEASDVRIQETSKIPGEGTESNESEVLYLKSELRKKLLRYYSSGEEFHILPQYYTRKLDDPTTIDTNLIRIVSSYYMRSLLYEARSNIKDECETLLDLIGQSSYNGKTGTTSNTYEEARRQMNRTLYDERTARFGSAGWLAGRFLSNLRSATTAVNLGAKPSIGLTALISTIYKMVEGAFGGADYGVTSMGKSLGHLILDIINPVKWITSPFLALSSNTNKYLSSKRMAIAIHFNLAELLENSLKYLDQNWYTRILRKHNIYGLMTIADYASKTTIAETILRSYRFVDGEFITKQQIENRKLSYGEDEYNRKLKEYKKAKSLYKLYKNNNGRLEVEDKYKLAEENAYNLIERDILNTAQMMDGIPTQQQRTSASAHPLFSLFFIHRNYLSVLSQRYWRKSTYSYETHRYVNGIHRQVISFVSEMIRNNLLLGSLMSAGIGSSVVGPGGMIVGASVALLYKMYQNQISENSKTNKENKTISEVFKNNFGKNISSELLYMESLHKQRNAKQIIAEMALHYIIFNILLETFFFPYADKKENEDKMLLQILAYCLRKVSLETFNQYSFSDAISTFRSASAAQSLFDKADVIFNSVSNVLFPNGNLLNQLGLWDAFSHLYKSDKIQTGPYEGWNRGSKSLWRLLPWSNFYHETSNTVDLPVPDWGGKSIRLTRRHYENTVLHIKNTKNDTDNKPKLKKKKKKLKK